MPRVLFICKRRQAYGGYSSLSSGLLNSATFVSDMLAAAGIDSMVVQVLDNNAVDREVHRFAPTHVFTEALWVVPEKFDQLKRLHPKVRWIVRLHSNVPFIASEGVFVQWALGYAQRGIEINTNSEEMQKALSVLGIASTFLPNFYPVNPDFEPPADADTGTIDVGCFGAIRPLKNQFMQALAARKFADELGRPLRFHINGSRVEGNGQPILKNLRSLFATGPHTMIEHRWLEHADFIALVRTMDVCMQVSYSETFNITAADAASENVPVVASDQVPWVHLLFAARPNSIDHIAGRLRRAYVFRKWDFQALNKVRLIRYARASRRAWLRYLG